MIELMVTTVLIGIITAMAGPQFQKLYERIKLRTQMREMTSILRLARSTSIATKVQHGVFFDPTTRTVTYFKDVADLNQFMYTTADSVIKVDTLPVQFVWMGTDCTNNTICFRANGSAGYTGNGNVWTLGYTSKVVGTSTTNVLASTGRVSMQVWIY